MLYNWRLVALLILLCASGHAPAATDPSAVVDDVARAIDEHCCDAEVGERRGRQSGRHLESCQWLQCLRARRFTDQSHQPKNWEGSGVIPDVSVPADDALRKAQMLALAAVVEQSGAEQAVAAQWALAALQADASAIVDLSFEEFEGSYGAMAIRANDANLLLAQGRRPVRTLVFLVFAASCAGQAEKWVNF